MQELVTIVDGIQLHLQFGMNSIEDVFNSTIARPIGRMENKSVPSGIDHIYDHRILVYIQFIFRFLTIVLSL